MTSIRESVPYPIERLKTHGNCGFGDLEALFEEPQY